MDNRTAKPHLISMLEGDIDALMASHGFVRNAKSIVYKRKTRDGLQELNVHTYSTNRGDDLSLVHIAPMYALTFKEVSKALQEWPVPLGAMAKRSDIVAAGPIGHLLPLSKYVEWCPLTLDDFRGPIKLQIESFLREWVLPFFNTYQSMKDVTAGTLARDPRLPNGGPECVTVAICMCLSGEAREAAAFLRRGLERYPLRDKFEEIIQFIEDLAAV